MYLSRSQPIIRSALHAVSVVSVPSAESVALVPKEASVVLVPKEVSVVLVPSRRKSTSHMSPKISMILSTRWIFKILKQNPAIAFMTIAGFFHTNKKGVLGNLILVNTYIFGQYGKNIDSNGIFW